MIAVASDHAGFHLKRKILDHLMRLGYPVMDLGAESATVKVDYPDCVAALGRGLQESRWSRCVAVCGSGIGVSMALNRLHGVRAVTAWSIESAQLSRLHNDSNALCLGERLLDSEQALSILDAWLKTDFEGDRHRLRVKKLDQMSEIVAKLR
ncbi:MAG: ribose 5-phosphate isomerase B [Oligoflexales bacterium]